MQDSQEILNLASAAGRTLLENGAEIYRVEETMERIADHYGESNENFFVLSNGIFTTGKSFANVEFIPIRGARLDRVVAVNQLSRDIAIQNLSCDEAFRRIESIRNMPGKPVWEQLAGTLLGCGGFCAIFGGGFSDCAASMVAGLLMYSFVLFIGSRMSKILSNIFGGLIGTALCLLLHQIGFGTNLGNMIIGTLIPLIPGVPFTNGLRDMANEDYIAGATRLLDALVVFFCIAIGVSLSFLAQSWIAGGMIQLHGTVTDSQTALFPIQLAAAFIGTAAFAVLFGVPRKYYVPSGLVGTAGWLVYLLCLRFTPLNVAGGTFCAATVVAFTSRLCAVKLKCPSTVFIICGIFPLIPGAGVFWSTYYTVSSQLPAALGAGFTAVKVTIAIVLGIIVAMNIPRPRFKLH